MALVISFRCVNCWGCIGACPQNAIQASDPVFHIQQASCDECTGLDGLPKCVAVCPVDLAITDRQGHAIFKTTMKNGKPNADSSTFQELEEMRLYEEWLY